MLFFVCLVIATLSPLATTTIHIHLSALLPFCLFYSVPLCSALAKAPCASYLQTFALATSAAHNHSPYLCPNSAELKFCLFHSDLLHHSPHRWLILSELLCQFSPAFLLSAFHLVMERWCVIFMCGQEEALLMVFKSTGLRGRLMFSNSRLLVT